MCENRERVESTECFATCVALLTEEFRFRLDAVHPLCLDKLVFDSQMLDGSGEPDPEQYRDQRQYQLDLLKYRDRQSDYRFLSDPFARRVLAVIWMDSPFVPESVLKMCDRQREKFPKGLTNDSLGGYFFRNLPKVAKAEREAVVRSVGRITKPARAVDLVVYAGKIMPNKKPLVGTPLLHKLMLEANEIVGKEVVKMLAGEGGVTKKVDPPDDGEE